MAIWKMASQAVITTLVVLVYASTVGAQPVLYVDDDSVGGDGSSWAQAHSTLVQAMSAAAGLGAVEIRVAAGQYVPASSGLVDPREATFQLVNNVTIRGGYAGTGHLNPDAQNPRDFVTILSGDLSGDDGPDFANNGENCYHVVTGSGTDLSAVLDGFTITAGNADGNTSRRDGGGIYIAAGSPTVSHCRFVENWAGSRGGGMTSTFDSSPNVTNCLFTGNVALQGGGMWNGFKSNPMITNCTFTANVASGEGGGFFNRSTSSKPTITNSIFWANLDNGGMDSSAQIHVSSGSPLVNYSCVQGGWSGAGGVGIVSFDPLFADAEFHLDGSSPCIDAGDNTMVSVSTDLSGMLRRADNLVSPDVGNGTIPLVDIGAHEFAFAFDGDGDGDVDIKDFSTFIGCFSGSLQPVRATCQNDVADRDHDGDVDIWDFLMFSDCYNGAGNPPNCP